LPHIKYLFSIETNPFQKAKHRNEDFLPFPGVASGNEPLIVLSAGEEVGWSDTGAQIV
jgi:hypothetical protein